ncbi:UDP-glucose 6-dehydrogenase AglM [Candidatus Burarchaeum australiense]|nr:UDP-glucose 6-dehydrogenase AglM [Candidatus Burarchaeum australiense]
MADLCVVGTGYVGLVTGACFAELGHRVWCVDLDDRKVALINAGKSPIYEPGLDELLKRSLKRHALVATTSLSEAVTQADFSFLCVGTPSAEDGSTDLSIIRRAASELGKALHDKHVNSRKSKAKKRHVVIVKSTVPPGTSESLDQLLREAAAPDFGMCMNPEFLREGSAVNDFLQPDRIVVGGNERKDVDAVGRLYAGVKVPLIKTGLRTAEMIKYASNSFLATKISFANELANMCEQFGIDVYEVADGMGYDRRIGRAFLNAGAGFGGSCFKKDVSSLIYEAKKRGSRTAILDAVMGVNELQPFRVVDLLERGLGSLSGKRIALLGLAFKDETDDIRDSAAIKVARALVKKGALVVAYDPKAAENARRELGGAILYANSPKEALKDADACALVTEWKSFGKIPLSAFKYMRGRLVVEGRQVLDKKALKKAGFKYLGIGRA